MTVLGHITPEVINIFLSEAADLLGQWDEACFSLDNGGDSREALLWISRSIQSLRRASRGIGLEDFAQTLNAADEYLRLVLRAGHPFDIEVSSTLMLTHGVLSRWIVGLRTDAQYREDLTDLNDSIRQQKATVQKRIEDERAINDSKSISTESDELVSDGSLTQSTVHETALRSLVESNGGTLLSETDTRIPHLIDLLAQLSTQHSAIENAFGKSTEGSPKTQRMLGNMGLLINELCESAVGLRLVPVGGLFERLALFAVESAQCKGAAIQVDYDGQLNLLDKSLVSSLWDPLSRVVRWMVETSFEPPEERVKTGKLPMGVLRMSATTKNSIVKIVIEDDGRGQGDGDSTPQGQAVRTFVDTARSLLREMSATLIVHAALGRSTKVEINVPAAPRLLELAFVHCSDLMYAIPLHVLDDIIEPGCFNTHILRGDKQLIEYNGKLYPFVTLLELLEKTQPSVRLKVQATVAIERGHVLLVRFGRDFIAVGVDQLLSKKSTLVTPPQSHLAGVKGLLGTIISGSGEPVPVIDILEAAASFLGSRQDREVA